METVYPRSDHYPPHPEISNEEFYFCYTGGNSSGKHWIGPIIISKSSGNHILGQIFGHQRAENEARNTKMYRGQETHPIGVNARYEMNCANVFFFKKFRNPIFSQIFGHQRAENEARNTKMYRGQETHPLRVNARYEMNWVNSLFKNVRGNPIIGQIFGHQRAENEARNIKMYRGRETRPKRVNARHEMNGVNSFFKKLRKPHFRRNIWPPEDQKIKLGTRKLIGVKRLNP